MHYNFKDRTGVTSISNQGYLMKVIAYRGMDDIDILMDDKYVLKNMHFNAFKDGRITNPCHKSVHGVGFIGVGDYACRLNGVQTTQYTAWSNMLTRCYASTRTKRNLTYADCTVCDEWHNFQNFAKWWNETYYTVAGDTMHLDKDILLHGNRLYSSANCVFVPSRINYLFLKKKSVRGNYPIGVHKDGRRYYAQVSFIDKIGVAKQRLGSFATPELAFEAYKTAKEAYIKQVADEYKDKIPKRLYDALYAYKIEITD